MTGAQFELFDRRRHRRPSPFDLHALSRPAGTFTGDFYYTHRYEDRIWFALGDVAGKGIDAAVLMAMAQEELEHRIDACARTRCDPAATMLRLHNVLRPVVPRNRFLTVVIGHLCDDGALTLANAGHCPPLIVRRDGAIERIGPTGPVAALLPSASWSSWSTKLEAGDALLLYSDGVIESRSPDDHELGVDAVAALLAANRDRSARDIAEATLAAVDAHAAGRREDDVTILVIRR
ncbi:MAG TPA: PP2C family protein-serine/threonine phosphatase [Thermoanaerobaculia bacterium]|nr:PP2C family protein-serine/threonine phosphatase [Thermoanaerobaculia bacterium]